MPIDWFTVGAQVVNFLILVWLLKRFLYRPILGAIDAREARILQERSEADALKNEAQAALDDFRKKSTAFDQDRAALLQKATDEANEERQRLMAAAQEAAAAATAKRTKAYQSEARNLDKAIASRAQDEVFAIARKVLKDLADARLEDRMCDVFIHQIKAFRDHPHSPLQEAIRSTSGPISLRTAYDLTKSQHAAIQSAVQKTFDTEAVLHFETAPDLVSGIELSVGGQKLAWSISEYLTGLQEGLDEVLRARDKPQVKPMAAHQHDLSQKAESL